MKENTCCFIGHGIIPYEKRKVTAQLFKEEIAVLINNGYLYFEAGGALGFDI